MKSKQQINEIKKKVQIKTDEKTGVSSKMDGLSTAAAAYIELLSQLPHELVTARLPTTNTRVMPAGQALIG